MAPYSTAILYCIPIGILIGFWNGKLTTVRCPASRALFFRRHPGRYPELLRSPILFSEDERAESSRLFANAKAGRAKLSRYPCGNATAWRCPGVQGSVTLTPIPTRGDPGRYKTDVEGGRGRGHQRQPPPQPRRRLRRDEFPGALKTSGPSGRVTVIAQPASGLLLTQPRPWGLASGCAT